MEFKEKIDALREKYSDEPSRAYIADLETEYAKILSETDLLTHPLFVKIAEEANTRINEINTLLMNDEELTEERRIRLYADRKAFRFIFTRFGLATRDSALKALDALVDTKLEQ